MVSMHAVQVVVCVEAWCGDDTVGTIPLRQCRHHAQVVSLCARLERQPGVIAAVASRRVQGYASSPELQARPSSPCHYISNTCKVSRDAVECGVLRC